MREFMDYLQSSFYAATGWDRDNSYSTLNATSDALLAFPTPRGLRLSLSSLSTPRFATAYQLGTVGVVDGSVSYLYSTAPLLNAVAQSERTPLPDLLRGYRPLKALPATATAAAAAEGGGGGGRGWDGRAATDTLAYGRLYLPMSMLEALVVKRVSPALQMQVSAVSDRDLKNGGTVLGMVQYDVGRYGVEGLASSDGGLLGVRGLYNFGGDVEDVATANRSNNNSNNSNGGGGGVERDRIYGRLSTGAELYYGTLNKSGGMSVGMRFATLPAHAGTPLTATMTINPLVGNMSWTYSVMAGKSCSLASMMSFNVYSYESDWAVGMELWRKKGDWTVSGGGGGGGGGDADENEQPAPAPEPRERSFRAKMEWRRDEPLAELLAASAAAEEDAAEPSYSSSPRARDRSFQAKMEWRPDDAERRDEDEYSGVLKARLDQHLRVGLLWEGRVKSLLFSLGSGVDLRRLDSPFRTLGLELQFSS